MKKETKPYITLRDRQWKGKVWFTSWRSYKNIRRLTEAEAKEIDDIQEVKPKKEPTSGVVGEKDSRMFCLKCGSQKGFYVFKMRQGKQVNWYNIYTCPDCEEREKRLLYKNVLYKNEKHRLSN